MPLSETGLGGELLRQQLPEHKRQNPAVPVMVDLNRSVDSQLHRQRLFCLVFAFDLEPYVLPGLDPLQFVSPPPRETAGGLLKCSCS